MTTAAIQTPGRRYDGRLSLTVLAVLYGAFSAAAALLVGVNASSQLGVLTLLLALVVGLLLAGATATVTMAVLDLRRAGAVTSSLTS